MTIPLNAQKTFCDKVMFNFVSMWKYFYYIPGSFFRWEFSLLNEIGIDTHWKYDLDNSFCKNVKVAIGSEIVCSSSSFLCKHCTISDVPVREHLAYNYASCATIGKYNNNIDSFLITRSAVVILTAGKFSLWKIILWLLWSDLWH